jgi:Xaa-Pro dipeptidase
VSEPLAFDTELDLDRMRRERRARLTTSMAENGVETLVLLGQTNVGYATGARVPAADQARALHRRPVAVVTADGELPHLWTWCPDGVPTDLPADHVHRGLDLEWDDGARELVEALPSGSVVVDDFTMPLREAFARAGRQPSDAGVVFARAKVRKTADELECLRRAQAINEAAIATFETPIPAGTKGTDLSAHLLRTVFELGATSNTVDPVWQAMPLSIAAGPYSATGDVVFPTVTTDRPFVDGDVVWVDNGISYEGYQSDFGHTWVVGRQPDARQRAQCATWREIVDRVVAVTKPGATARDLTRAAGLINGRRPWLSHLYLAHGTGTDSAEMPFVGTDLGDEFDASFVLQPGMVLVLEPVVWEDGAAGFRAEQIVAVTETGNTLLNNLNWDDWE